MKMQQQFLLVSGLILSALVVFPVHPAFGAQQDALPLVVMIRAEIGNIPSAGAGIIIGVKSNRIYIVTANHVVRKGTHRAETPVVQLKWLPGESVPATLLSNFDGDLDLAILSVPGARELEVPEFDWKILRRPSELQPGADVFPVGNPQGRPWFVPVQPHHVNRVDPQFINTEGNLVSGNSGGALFTDDWQLVGLVSTVDSLLGQSARIDLIMDRLKAWNYPVQLEFGGSRATPSIADAVEPETPYNEQPKPKLTLEAVASVSGKYIDNAGNAITLKQNGNEIKGKYGIDGILIGAIEDYTIEFEFYSEGGKTHRANSYIFHGFDHGKGELTVVDDGNRLVGEVAGERWELIKKLN